MTNTQPTVSEVELNWKHSHKNQETHTSVHYTNSILIPVVIVLYRTIRQEKDIKGI